MSRPAIIVEGDRELRRALKQVAGGTDDLKAAHADGAEIVAERARQIVPRRSGLLESTIRSAGQAKTGVVRAGRARVPYAGPIHFGWAARNISPQPFLYDALDERRDEVVERYEKQVGDLIEKHGL